jgi:peptide/nickel transport system permease protein
MSIEPSALPSLDTVPTLNERTKRFMRRVRALFCEPAFSIGMTVIVLLVLMAIFAPLLAPYDPAATNAAVALRPPSAAHWMGTDQLGRDVLSRVFYGARLSMTVSVLAVSLAMVIGTLLGLLGGYLKGLVDGVLMRAVDILLAFPGLVLAIVLAAIFGTGMEAVVLAIGIAGVPTFARVTRAAVMNVAADDFVLAARSIGCSPVRIMFRHVLPNVAGPILIVATLYLAFAILAASTLSFLGIGIRPPTAEWGAMINDGRNVVIAGWWVGMFPATMIMLFVLAVNLVGEVLRDQLDATLRTRTADL